MIKRAINLCLQAVQYVVFYYSGLNRLRNDTNDHGSGDNLFEILVSIFWINNKKWNCWSIWYYSTFNFLRNIHPVFHSSCSIFIPTNYVQISCSFCIHIVFSFPFFFFFFLRVKWYLIVVLTYIPLMCSQGNVYWLCQSLCCVDHNKLWKILKEIGIPDHLTCLLRNLYGGQQATVRTGHGTTDWF